MTIKTNNKTLINIFEELKSQYGGDFDNNPLPVEKWNPDFCGDIGIEIRKDGTWWQNGTIFTRDKLIRLFCKILKREDDGKDYLVTPYEKIIVKVEDAHFQIVRADLIIIENIQKIILTPNYGLSFEIDEEHPFWIKEGENGPRPYAKVRGNLIGLLTRSVYYDLVAMGQFNNDEFGIFSNNIFYKLGEINV